MKIKKTPELIKAMRASIAADLEYAENKERADEAKKREEDSFIESNRKRSKFGLHLPDKARCIIKTEGRCYVVSKFSNEAVAVEFEMVEEDSE